MNIGQRIRERLADLQLSQSELARRVGVRQSTVHSLITGDSRSSKYLHLIARELGTTPAFLTGEVDDPEQDAPPAPALTRDQAEMLQLFDALAGPERALLAEVARSMRKGVPDRAPAAIEAGNDDISPPRPAPVPSYREFTLPVLFPPEYALTRMFEALLAMVDPAAPTEEQARLLAMNLPVGLSQLRDLLPSSTPADLAGASSDQPMTLAEQQ